MLVKMPILLFKVIGILVLCYIGRCYATGEVYACSNIWGRTYRRSLEPLRYWFTLAFYFLLSLALIFFFGRL